MRILIVGVGNRGKMVVDYFGVTPGWRIAGLVDKSQGFLEQASKEWGITLDVCYTDLQQALENILCDAIFITSPTATHFEYCHLAFRWNKHVLVEKPMTPRYEDAAGLVQAAMAAKVCFCVAQNFRFMPHCQALAIHANDPESPYYPGQVEIINYTHQICRFSVRNATYPYSMVWELGSHHADLILAIQNEKLPTRIRSDVFATSWTPYSHPVNIRSWIDYGAECRIQHLLTFDSTVNNLEVILMGGQGALRLDNQRRVWFHSYGESVGVESPVQVPFPESVSLNGFHEIVENWKNYIHGGEEPVNSGRRNLNVLRFCQSLIDSAEAGGEVFELKEQEAKLLHQG